MISTAELERVHANADCLYEEAVVEEAITKCAEQTAAEIASLSPVVLPVMNGGLSFADRLLAHWDFPLELDYIHFSRYRGELSGGQNKQIAEPQTLIEGRHVVVVDDIFDEGLTLAAIVDWAKAKGASGVTTVILADKQHQRKQTSYRPDYVALTLPDRYVYGFGMDYKGWLRNKRGIYALAESV